MRVIDGFPNFKTQKFSEYKYEYEDVLRKVPGMYKFELVGEGIIL